jgi:hypothetical protein
MAEVFWLPIINKPYPYFSTVYITKKVQKKWALLVDIHSPAIQTATDETDKSILVRTVL